MRLFSRVPLALLNLLYDPVRFVVCIFGIGFAVFLMMAEWGFLNGLLDASVLLIDSFNGEVILTSPTRYNLNVSQKFPMDRLQQARMVEGVEHVSALYLEHRASLWRNTESLPGQPEIPLGKDQPITEPIRTIAFNPEEQVLLLPAVNEQRDRLFQKYNLLFDQKSKPDYGVVVPPTTREVRAHRVQIAGLFSLGWDFVSNGNVIMSDTTYAALFPNPLDPASTLDQVDVGIVRLKPEARDRAEEICAQLNHLMAGEVVAYTREDYKKRERDFWKRSTPIGFIFQMGMWMGFLVGAGICYQILSADVLEYLREYATLKAIGYRDRYLGWVVVQEGLWLGLAGFFPGCLGGQLLYWVVEKWFIAGLPMHLTLGRALTLLGLTLGMCILSGLLALRKVQLADPAEVF